MSPQQQLFGRLLTDMRNEGYDVYDGSIPDNAPYPFVYIGESQTVGALRKDCLQGTVYKTIHVYHNNHKRRGELSQIINDIIGICVNIANTTNWILAECSEQVVPDDSTNTPLMHGIIDVGFRF